MKKSYFSIALNAFLIIAIVVLAGKLQTEKAGNSLDAYLAETEYCDYSHPNFNVFSVSEKRPIGKSLWKSLATSATHSLWGWNGWM